MVPFTGRGEVQKLRNAPDLASDFSHRFASTTKEDLVSSSSGVNDLISCCIFLVY